MFFVFIITLDASCIEMFFLLFIVILWSIIAMLQLWAGFPINISSLGEGSIQLSSSNLIFLVPYNVIGTFHFDQVRPVSRLDVYMLRYTFYC